MDLFGKPFLRLISIFVFKADLKLAFVPLTPPDVGPNFKVLFHGLNFLFGSHQGQGYHIRINSQ